LPSEGRVGLAGRSIGPVVERGAAKAKCLFCGSPPGRPGGTAERPGVATPGLLFGRGRRGKQKVTKATKKVKWMVLNPIVRVVVIVSMGLISA
jgi:hypothetical protein